MVLNIFKQMSLIRIWTISDTHCCHNELSVPSDIDIVIHAGDFSNSKNQFVNSNEVSDFIEWFAKLDIDRKILVSGNHDTSMELKLFDLKREGIIYLEQDSAKLYKNRIYGTPYTPEFGRGWGFQLKDDMTKSHASSIPPCEILITHGPPKFILDSVYRDLCYGHQGDLELYHRIHKIKPKLHIFGHIHSSKDNKYPENNGVYFDGNTWFINTSCCVDGIGYKIKNHGWIIEYDIENKKVLNIQRNEK